MTTAIEAYRSAVPARLLRDLSAATPLLTGRQLLCQVARPATDQGLVAHTDVWPNGEPSDELDAREELEAAMRRIGHRDWQFDDDVRLTSAVVIVVFRDGRAVSRSSDYAAGRALRYANNPFQALRSDIIIVTPHGWITEPDELGGLAPVAVIAGRAGGPSASLAEQLHDC